MVKQRKKTSAKVLSVILTITMVVTLIPAALLAETETASAATVSAPRVISGGVTWDCVYFGNYCQSSSSLKEPIKWRVLRVDGNKALLLSDKIIAKLPYNEVNTNITWGDCTLRKWLNNSFMDEAFTLLEQAAIVEEHNGYTINPSFAICEDNKTIDKIWLPSVGIVRGQNGFDEDLYWTPNKRRVAVDADGKASDWWLEGPGYNRNQAMYVDKEGGLSTSGSSVSYTKGVRPALWLNLSSQVWRKAGTVSSVVNETEEIKTTGDAGITEEQLYGEYCRYLSNNPAYKQMLGEVYTDLEDIIYVSDDKVGIAAISTALKNGFIKNLKAIVGGYSGKFYSEKELEEAVAQDLLLAISGDKYLLSEITKETKKLYKADSSTYKLISQGAKTATAYKLYGIGFANGYKEDQIIQLIESVNKNWEPIGKVFKAAGISINAVETAVMLLETRDADMYTLNKIAGKVNDESALHSGLMRIYNKNKGTTPEAMVKEWLKNDVFEFVASEALGALSGAFSPVEFAFSLLGHAESLCSDGADMEDIDKAFISWSNDNQIRLAVSDIIQKMALNHQNGGSNDYSKDFKFFKEAQFKSLEVCVKYANEVGTSKQKAKLNKDYNKYKSLFNIDSYIQSCLANANADWKYKVVDSKAIIKGVNNGISTGSVSTIAERLGMVAYADDTTDSVLNVLVVPEEVDGYEVDSIDTRAFANNNKIEFAYIPETVTEVGNSAFEGCSNLKSVFFENGIETIAENAFADCSSLDSVELPVSLTSVDSTAFTGIDSITVYAVEGTEGQSFAENSNATYESMEPEVTEISIDTLPTKTLYKMSEEEIDASGIKVTATLETGDKTDVSSDVYCYFKDKQLGNSKISVVYEGCETTYDVTVNADECSYTVSYENELGEEIADKVSGKAVAGTQLKLDIKEIKGYIPEKSEQTVTIGADNDFVVLYSAESATDIEAVQVSGIKDVVYTGKAYTPEPVLTYNGKALLKGRDYYVIYDENINVGTGRLLITGTGDFCGSKTMEFQIKPVVAPQKTISANLYGYDDFKVSWSSQKVAGATVKYKVEYKRYGGNWYTIYKGTTATSVKKVNLTDGVRYAFRVTPYVTVDNKNYYGKSKSTGYIYTLKKLNRPSVKKSSKYYTRVYWNNIPGETGYEIARSKYSTKKFSIVKRVNYKYKSTTIKTPRNVKYYYKVRAYKTVNGKKIYGPWSSVKSYTL